MANHVFTEVQEMEQNLPKTCQVLFEDPNKLHSFLLYISPDDGYWTGGRFKFIIDVPDEYNIVVKYLFLLAYFNKYCILGSFSFQSLCNITPSDLVA